MRGINLLIKIIILSGSLLEIRCGIDSLAGGTSTSENGKIVGQLVTTSGSPAFHAQVSLIPADFDPKKSSKSICTDTTDASGNYSFVRVENGDYTIQSVGIESRTRGLHFGIRVAEDTINLKSDTLRKPGSIKVILSETTKPLSGYVYIPGTTISVNINNQSKSAILDSVPAGIIPALMYSSIDTDSSSVLRYTLVVRSQDTAIVRNTLWKYSRQLRLNTSVSGADINETLYRFPILIRLTRNNFDFSSARSDGADIQFTKQDNKVLSREIERWDVVNRVAEIWVNVDTITGNDTSRYITMYWGNSQVVDDGMERPRAFDTADGFGAVWHLCESSDTLYDATENHYNGIKHGNLKSKECMIGLGQIFYDSGTYCDMGNVLNPENGNFTISAWVKRSRTGLQTIMAKSDGGTPSSTYGWSLSFGVSNNELHCFTASNGSDWGETGAFDFWSKPDAVVTDTTIWHYVAAVVDRSDNKNCKVYLDDEDVTGSSNGNIKNVGSLVNSLSLRIGAESDGDFSWTGSIDECVISRVARSTGWNKLCYINQGPNDRLVEFR